MLYDPKLKSSEKPKEVKENVFKRLKNRKQNTFLKKNKNVKK
jgi:hypothetical protein